MTQPPSLTRSIVIKRIAPVGLGVAFAWFSGVLTVLIVPLYLFLKAHPPASSRPLPVGPHLSAVVILCVLLLYVVGGFVFGVFAAWIYNLGAKLFGGVRVDAD